MHNENPLRPYKESEPNSNLRLWIAGIAIFFAGFSIGNVGKTVKPTVCPTPSPVVSKAELTELKVIDDKLMNSMANVIDNCGTGMTQISKGNFNGLDVLTEKVNTQTEIINNLTEKRAQFVKENL